MLHRDPEIELRLWKYFVVVAEEQHLGRAAERLEISVSPLSRQIRALESELGTPLFDRVGRSLRLNTIGASLVSTAQRLVRDAVVLEALAHEMGRGDAGEVHVGAVEAAVGSGGFREFIARCRAELPGISVCLHTRATRTLVHEVTEGLCDFALIHPRDFAEAQQLRYVELWREDFCLVSRGVASLEAGEHISAEQLQGVPLVIPAGSMGRRIRQELAEHGLPDPNVIGTSTQLLGGLAFLQAIGGAALVQRGQCSALPAEFRVSEVDWFAPKIDLGLIHQTPIATSVIDEMVSICVESFNSARESDRD